MRRDMDLWRGNRENPFREMFALSDRLNRLFDDILLQGGSELPMLEGMSRLPLSDFQETDKHYLMSVDLPGVPKDNIKIDVEGNQIKISGERREEKKSREGRSRSFGRFERSFLLPSDIDAEKIEANYHDGVLELAIPKAERGAGRRVQIGEEKSGFIDRFLGRGEERGEAREERREEGRREESRGEGKSEKKESKHAA